MLHLPITFQDYQSAEDKPAFLLEAVQTWKCSTAFRTALDANAYFRGENPTVAAKTVLRASKMETRDERGRKRSRAVTRDVVGNRVASGYLYRFVTQQCQYLLGSGVTLCDGALKARLGKDFDRQLARIGEKALLHGVCWGYWNTDRIEMIEAARDPWSGFLPLPDEMSGQPRMGIQFWQLSAWTPMVIRLFEETGISLWRCDKNGRLENIRPLRPYLLTQRADLLHRDITAEIPLRFPVVPFYANAERRSELTPAIRSKIDCYDRILSDFADNLDRANDVYWVLNNFGGTAEDIAETLEEINRLKAVANLSDGTGSAATAEPHTISVPYEARSAALRLLEKALYSDYMALDMSGLTGSSLTNVAIRAAAADLDLKANRFEWEAFAFVRDVLRLQGVDTDEIRFQRQSIANESETVRDIVAMRPDIDQRTALRLNPYIQPEEVDGILGKEEKAEGPLSQLR